MRSEQAGQVYNTCSIFSILIIDLQGFWQYNKIVGSSVFVLGKLRPENHGTAVFAGHPPDAAPTEERSEERREGKSV